MSRFLDVEASRILVIGGAGVLGSRLVDELIDLGSDVTVVDNLRTGSLEKLPKMNQEKSLVCLRRPL